MAVMIARRGAAAVFLVRRMMGRMMMAAVVAAGEQSARCEKGDGCGEFLLILQSKYTSPCHGDQLLSFARIVTCEGWKLVSKGLERHEKLRRIFLSSGAAAWIYRRWRAYFAAVLKT